MLGLTGLVASYFLPFALQLKLPSVDRSAPLPQLALPGFSLPAIRVPDDAAAPAPPQQRESAPKTTNTSAPAAAAPTRGAAPTTAPVTVVTTVYTLVPQPKQQTQAKDPFENVPVVGDSLGAVAPPADPNATQGSTAPPPAPTPAATAEPAAPAVEAPPPAEYAPPAPTAEPTPPPTRTLQSAASEEPAAPAEDPVAPAEPAPPAAEPEPAPAPETITSDPSGDATASPGPSDPIAPEPVTTVEPTTVATTTTTTVWIPVAQPLAAPAQVDFGAVTIESSASRTVEITNLGDTDISILDLTVADDDEGAFSLLAGEPSTLAAGATGSFALSFSSKKVGTHTARLVAVTDGPDGDLVVQLSGEGTRWAIADNVAARGPPPAEEALNHTLRITANGLELVGADGVADVLSLDGITSVSISGGGGDDVLRAEFLGEAPVPIAFDGGAGSDTF
ncbi:MAG TPA: hypothetical protein VF044_03205, partial [Actinomycetota bacterium]